MRVEEVVDIPARALHRGSAGAMLRVMSRVGQRLRYRRAPAWNSAGRDTAGAKDAGTSVQHPRRTVPCLVLILMLALAPKEGVTSGSSTVSAIDGSVWVSLSSVGVWFYDAEEQSHWHRAWRAEHQPQVDAMVARLAEVLVTLDPADPLPLVPFSTDLAEARGDVPTDHHQSPEQVCAVGACRIVLRPTSIGVGELRVEIAVAGPLSAAQRERLAAVLPSALVPGAGSGHEPANVPPSSS